MRSLTAMLTGAMLATAAWADAVDPHVAQRFTGLTRDAVWTRTTALRLPFRTFHPQGMVRVGPYWFISSVEVVRAPCKLPVPVDGHAYDTGAGIGHLFKVDPAGRLIADLRLGEGSIYHPGGMDYDGRYLWVPVAEYRPNSRSIIYRITPATMRVEQVLTVPDHIGGVVHDTDDGSLNGLSWGSRRFYRWPLDADGGATAAPEIVANPGGYIDYQDCHYAGARQMLCGGLASYRLAPWLPPFSIGGIDLIDLTTHRPAWQVPVPLWTPLGRPMTQNPFWMEATQTGLRAWFVPEDEVSTLYAYEVKGR